MPPAPVPASRCSMRPHVRSSKHSSGASRRWRPPSSRASSITSLRPWRFRTRAPTTLTCAAWWSCPHRRNPSARARLAAAGRAAPKRSRRTENSDHRVGERRLTAGDVVEQRLVDRRIERRLDILGELLFPERIRALGHIGRTFRFPLLVAVVVRERGAIERILEIGLRMGAAQKVLAGPDLAYGIQRLAIHRQVYAREQRMHHAGLIHVHDEFLVAHREAALEPA